MSAFDRLSPALQYQIVNTLGFSGLRPVQEEATDALLDGKNAVILAPTAGGKTEAAFFPALSLMDSEDWKPVSVIYLSPIRALLNNQETRVSKYAGMLGRTAFKWHGDVTDSQRKKFLRNPADILLTTPESIEAMLMSARFPAREIFDGLRLVIIDEIHAFADDDRGAHLVSLLERLTRYCQKDLQRVGLSATVGNPEEILRWVQGSSGRERIIVNPGGAKKNAEIALDYVQSYDNAAKMVKALHPGQKRLVFVDSRAKSERLGSILNALGVVTYVNHGSLSLTARRDAERAFEQGEDCVIVATSTLELGIDVGDLDRVLQIDCPRTVASFLQRMGRTGRRGGAPNCTFLVVEDKAVLQAAALLQLHRDGWVEPVQASSAAYHILAQQLMALCVQNAGTSTVDWFRWLQGATVYENVSDEERTELVDFMVSEEILSHEGGKFWLGPKGEKKYAGGNFRELYAVFEAPRLILVKCGTEEIGTVDVNFLAAIDNPGERASFILGARHWQVVHVDWESGTCQVMPSESGKAPRWNGGGGFLSYEMCQAMRKVLLGHENDPAWSKRTIEVIDSLRAEHSFLDDAVAPLIDSGRHLEWFTFAGGAANVLLARILEAELGERVIAHNTSIIFREKAAESRAAVMQTIVRLANEGRPNLADAIAYSEGESRRRFSKFEPCVPERLLAKLLAERTLDLAGAQKVLEQFKTGGGRNMVDRDAPALDGSK
jgi:ATP-dependent helicase Lhr and Lhr-like helicase